MNFTAFLALPALFALAVPAFADPVTITVEAPSYAGQEVVLYRYLDAFTLRLERLDEGRTDAKGHAVLSADVEGTAKALLRIGEVGADLYLRPGSYHVQMPAPDAQTVRTLGGSARVDLTFLNVDRMDVNALVADLNSRLDAFLAEGLATNADAGMAAVSQARQGETVLVPDTGATGTAIYLSPQWDRARVDTFAHKLKRFYAEVDDPWFQHNVEYGLAGLRLGPRTDDSTLFNHYLKDKPVLYDVPEYTRFFSAFFKDHLLRFPFRSHTVELQTDIKLARLDSLKALLARNDFLKDDRLNELVLLTGLYAQQANKHFDHGGILRIFGMLRDGSAYPEHRRIAANMLWNLTAMTNGTALPAVEVLDTSGQRSLLPDALDSLSFVMVVSIGNPYSERELAAMETLHGEYGNLANFVCIALDHSPEQLAAWLDLHPQRSWAWYVPANQRLFLDQLRIRNAPVLFVAENGVLTDSPGPLPSHGLAAALHAMQVKYNEEHRLRPDRGVPPPKH